MGIGVAFAKGVVNTLNEIEKEKREAKIKNASADAAFDIFKREEDYKFGREKELASSKAEREKKAKEQEREMEKAAAQFNAKVDVVKTLISNDQKVPEKLLVGIGLPTDIVITTPSGTQEINEDLIKEQVGAGLLTQEVADALGGDIPEDELQNLVAASNAINAAGQDFLTFGSGDNSVKMKVQPTMGLKPDDPTAVASTFFNSVNLYLENPENFDKAQAFFSDPNNASFRETLMGEVRKNSNLLKNTVSTSAGKAGLKAGDLKPLDIANTYIHASKMFDALGFRTDLIEDVILPEARSQIDLKNGIEYNPETQDLLFLHTQTSTQIDPTFAAVVFSKEDIASGERLAKATGHKSFQNMLLRTSFRTTEDREEGMTDQDYARLQNKRMLAAIEMEKKGFGNLIRNPTERRTNPGRVTEFFTYLEEKFGDNQSEMLSALTVMYAQPSDYFEREPTTRYGTPDNNGTKASITSDKFAEDIGGDKQAFIEGYQATNASLEMLDELIVLEGEISEKIGSGFVRDFFAGLTRLTTQVKMGATTVANYFSDNASGENSLFGNTTTDTDINDLEAVVQKLNSQKITSIDLENMTAADSLRLALAAKMARAIDPAGRLSNQDFEIQLRRLGRTNLSTPGDIQRALKQVKKDFERDLEAKHLLYDLYNNKAELSEANAKKVLAYRDLREMQKRYYGAEGKPVASSTDTSTDGFGIPIPQGEAAITHTVPMSEGQGSLTFGYYRNKDDLETGFYVISPDGTGMRKPTEEETQLLLKQLNSKKTKS